MGSELVIVRWCDRCTSKGDDVAEHRVRVDDVDRVLDLCEACFGTMFGALVEAIAEIGQPPDRATPPRAPAVQTRDRTRRASPGTTDPDVRCKLCPHVCTSIPAVWQHARGAHNMTRSDYRAAATRPDSALGKGVAA